MHIVGGINYMPKIITITNEKGGIGKTTTVINMAAVLNREGHKTLVIDTDVQANTTDTYNAKIEGEYTLYDVLLESPENRIPLEKAIQHTELGDIIAADKLLSEADSKLASNNDPNGSFRLLDAIEAADLSQYEYIIIDTACSINTMLYNCLVASDEVIIPVMASRYSFNGLSDLNRAILSIKKRMNPKLKIKGFLLTMFNENHKIKQVAKEALEQIAESYGTKIYKTYIRQTVKVDEAVACKKSLIDYAMNSTAGIDYYDFVEEYLLED